MGNKVIPQNEQERKNCQHKHTVLETFGILAFGGGEVNDNLTDHVFCLDCLGYVGEGGRDE